jgi:K+-transporting ATPase KdpF subunit
VSSEPESNVASASAMPRKEERNAGHSFYDFHRSIFRIIRAVREILQWDEVTKMFDSILSLVVCGALLVYLVYAMLRPEKF